MSATDLVTAAIILSAAAALLVRSFSRGSGPCHGCGGCAAGKEKPQPLVTLRGGRRR